MRKRGPRLSSRFSGSFSSLCGRDCGGLPVGGRHQRSACRTASCPSRARENRPPASRAVPDATAARPGCRNRPRFSTMPVPKISCHMRFTATRAVSGWSSVKSHSRQTQPVARHAESSAAARRGIRIHLLALLIVSAAVQNPGDGLRVGALFHHQRDRRRAARSPRPSQLSSFCSAASLRYGSYSFSRK